MINHILSFSQFITESRYYGYVEVIEKAKSVFKDFKFEEPIPILINDLDTKYSNIKEKYTWNRENRSFHKDHFALNIKVYIWPDQEKVKEILGDQEISDNRINSIWWHWLNIQREVLVEGLDYDWIRDTGFGGNSGGWLLIVPDITDDKVFEYMEEAIDNYVSQKEIILRDVDIDHLKKYDSNPEYTNLADIGLVHDLAPLSELKEACDEVTIILTDAIAKVDRMNIDMEAILAQVNNFKVKGIDWFYDYLRDEYMEDFVEDDTDYN